MGDKQHKLFFELYQDHHFQLSRFCRAIAGNTADAEDLMSDTLLTVMESFTKIKDTSAFKSYIFSVASNLNKKKMRRLKFRAEFNDAEVQQLIDFGQNPEYATDFKIIYERMLSLPAKMAEALILFHISDLSLEEVQKIQGGSLSGVKLRLKRGREKLISMVTTPEQVKMTLIFFTL